MPGSWLDQEPSAFYIKAKPVEILTEENEGNEDTALKTKIASFSSLPSVEMQKLRVFGMLV